MNKKKYKMLFAGYLILFLLFVLLKFDGSFQQIADVRNSILENEKYGIHNLNLVPFAAISSYLNHITEFYAFRNIAGNMMVFVPMGFFVSILFFHKNGLRTLFMCMAVILLIEAAQLVFKIGYFDIDDIVLNALGCLGGYLLSLFCGKAKTCGHKKAA